MAKLFHYRNRDGGAIATVSELPFETSYDVYVYFNKALGDPVTYDLSRGGIAQTVTTINDASAFVEANDDNSYEGNYYVFKGVTGASFTLTVGESGSTSAYAYGMQIVETGHTPAGPATVTIAGPVSAGTEMEISWVSENGKPYGVETNSNLIIPNWQPFGSDVEGDGGTITVTNTIGSDQTFYRVISK